VIDASRLRLSEIVGISYLLYLSAAALIVRLPAARRIAVWLAAAFVLVIDVGAAARPLVWWGWSLRDWLPALVILIAYFATGALYVAPSPRFEAWLKEWDVRILGRRTFDALPTPLRVYFEIVYDFCFLLMPAGFATLVWLGHAASADRFWTIVSFAEFLPFGTLPWLQARPPWAIEARRDADRSGVRRFSLEWVEAVTIRANTFPSGHASGSLAVALALAQPAPRAALAFGVVAVSIAIASVVGRFHYAIDAITGLLLAIVIWYLSPFLGI
jgi:membrane-associated phospholipid phosphatase